MTESIEQIASDAAATIAAEQEALRREGRQQLAEEMRRWIDEQLARTNTSIFFPHHPGLVFVLDKLNQLQPTEKQP